MTGLRYTWEKFTGIARLRAFYWRHIRRYCCEVCQSCGRPVDVVWSAPDEVWDEVVGGPGGIRCVPCFNAEHLEKLGHDLRWRPEPL